MTQVGGVTLPGEIAGQVALDEVVLHAWDLAHATGQPYQQESSGVTSRLSGRRSRCRRVGPAVARTQSCSQSSSSGGGWWSR
jgi:hypothetical protein